MNDLVEMSRLFRAMSTQVEVVVCSPESSSPEAEMALDRVQNLFFENEKRFSRFRGDSELSALNRANGKKNVVSPQLYEILAAAVNAASLTAGIFDPTILNYLISAGYDRSFELMIDSAEIASANSKKQDPDRFTWKDLKLDPVALSVFIPEGCSIDLGGIAKGWTIDQAGQYLDKFENWAVNAGGDILVHGTQADGSAWTIGIEDPFKNKTPLFVLSLPGGALCTSTVTARRWLAAETTRHHIIDPRTGLPADTSILSATVISETSAGAEIISKAALVLGPEEGLQLIENQQSAGMLVLENSRCRTSSTFRKFIKSS